MKNNSELLSEFEKYKGYSSDLFDGEEWAQFDAFAQGYIIAKEESKTAFEILEDSGEDYNEYLNPNN